MKLLPKNRKLQLPFILAVIMIVLAVGAAAAYKFGVPRYHEFRERRTNNAARELFAKGDLNGALLGARKAANFNPGNADAWRLCVEITEKQNSQDQVFYQSKLTETQPTLENRLKLMHMAIKYNGYNLAAETAAKVGIEGSKSTEFLDLAAQIYRRMGNPTRAKYYLMSLLSLQPSNTAARFDLAQIRLLSDISENKESVRSEILSIAEDPAYRVRAFTLLLADSLAAKNSAEALSYADKLAPTIDAPAATQIYVAETYHRFAPDKFKEYLARLEKSSLNETNRIVVLVNYLSANGMAAEARRWVETLPEKTRAVESVQLNYAFSLLLLKDWTALDDFLRGVKWTENDYARHAILAYRQRMAGNDSQFNEEWRLALIDAGNNPRKLQTLQAQVASWNWEDQKYEILWKRFMLDPHKTDIRQALVVYEMQKGHTANLNQLFEKLVQIDPKDNDAKNNYAYTSMLLGVNLDRAYQLAEEVYNSNTSKASRDSFAGTYSYALYRQGKITEALNVLQNYFTLDQTRTARPLLYALYLAANGKVDEALAIAKHVDLAKLLPEERRLMNDLNGLAEKSQRQQMNVDRLAAISPSSAGSGDRKSWLATLPPQYKKNMPVNMELADASYANDDYRGIENALKGEQWNANDFLRLALLSYAERNQSSDTVAKVNWMAAASATQNRSDDLHTLADMAERWNWQPERIDILTRIYERDPTNAKAFSELVDYYNRNGSTSDLARVYDVKVEAAPSDADAKAHFAYYSLLTGTNVPRATVAAKEAFDAGNDNVFSAKAYAFSLIKQMRGTDADHVIAKIGNDEEGGQAQISLLRAAIAAQLNNPKQVRANLDAFKPAGSLPEESALADSLAKSLAKDA